MNILFDINHPAHVHFFKHAIKQLEKSGHHIVITSREKDVTLGLLDACGFSHRPISKIRKGLWGRLIELIVREKKIYQIIKKDKIDVCVGIGGPFFVHAAWLLGIPRLVFYDTEHATLQNMITYPFATKIYTPDCYKKELGKRHVRYKGVHEIAYLYPKYFFPNSSILDELGLIKGQKHILLRFVSWEASHDKGQKGLSLEAKRMLIEKLSEHAKVYIISEKPLDGEYKKYQLSCDSQRLHDVLYYASLCISEGATVVSECACLGVPSIYVNSQKLGYIDQERKYGLVFDIEKPEDVLQKALEILKSDKNEWKQKRDEFVKSKIDVTKYITSEILQYQ